MKITEVYILDSGPFEKAREYKRYDLCLKIADARRNKALAEFAENIQLYEQQYKDKATGKYYHRILWDEIIRRLKNDYDELGLPEPSYNHCYACTAKCEVCPISDLARPCSSKGSVYAHFVDALSEREMRDAWTR